MAVKIRKTRQIMGRDIEVTQYLPEDVPISKERREKADLLDVEIKKYVKQINSDYDSLDESIKKSEYKKWLWLGGRLDNALSSFRYLEPTDIYSNVIWPAFGQYMRQELKRGFDVRRSGGPKDHYRKCWLLATLPNLDWIKAWGGWDAFIDRGEQLARNARLMPLLNEQFKESKLSKNDYQYIAKTLTEKLPSIKGRSVDIDSMDEVELRALVENLSTTLGD